MINVSCAGDHQPVVIGDNSNVQDNAFVGALSEFSGPCVVGKNVSIGHGAVLKGCTVGDNVLVGINAVISENAVVRGLRVPLRDAPIPLHQRGLRLASPAIQRPGCAWCLLRRCR